MNQDQDSSSTFLPSPETERAVARLERHVEWHEGFWLAYVFTVSPPQAHILQDRVGVKLRTQGRTQRVLRPTTPEALEGSLPDLLADPSAGCTWLEVVRDHLARRDGGEWVHAWVQLTQRANERRERIRSVLSGGLILVAHPDLKVPIRDAGPDLWSIRTFTFVLPASGSEGGRGAVRTRGASLSFVDEGLLEDDIRRLPGALAGMDALDRARIKRKLAVRLQSAGRAENAIDVWREVISAYRTIASTGAGSSGAELAEALRGLGDGLSAMSRHSEAARAYEEAISILEAIYGTRERTEIATLLHARATALDAEGRYQEAQKARAESASIEEQDVVDELARVFWDPELARELLLRAGFPPGRIPAFKTPFAFWTRVVDEASHGLLLGGIQPIVDVAAQLYPGNAVFERRRRA